jgi:signal transduction histidine kinase
MLGAHVPNARVLGAVGALATLAWVIRRARSERAEWRRGAEARRLLGSDRLAMVAHELRTPLGAIGHAATLVETAGDSHPRLRAACSIIRRQAEQVRHLLDDLFVPAGSNGLALDHAPLDLVAVVTESVEGLRGLVEERGHRLTLTRPGGPLLVRGDGRRLAQVVTNLVWNAAKYTPAGGHVEVTVALEDDHAVLRVRDDGIGISPALTERIFRLFEQAGPPRADGQGIGLSLARLIVVRHGGEISAHSEGPGQGSEFIVRLPGHEAAADAACPAPVGQAS